MKPLFILLACLCFIALCALYFLEAAFRTLILGQSAGRQMGGRK